MAGKKIYLERLMLSATEAKVSLLTVGRLTPDLLKIKRHLGVPLVSLEDASIELSMPQIFFQDPFAISLESLNVLFRIV